MRGAVHKALLEDCLLEWTPNGLLQVRLAGLPSNRPVTLTFHSADPIVIQTVTDKEGLLTYELDQPLQPGRHTLKVSVLLPGDGGEVSATSDFLIGKAQAASLLNGTPSAATHRSPLTSDRTYLTAMLAIVLAGSIVATASARRWGLASQSALMDDLAVRRLPLEFVANV